MSCTAAALLRSATADAPCALGDSAKDPCRALQDRPELAPVPLPRSGILSGEGCQPWQGRGVSLALCVLPAGLESLCHLLRHS